jgi:hypothetical protein
MIAGYNISDTLTNGFDNTSSFVAEDSREHAFRI